MIVSSFESSICQGGKLPVMWVITSCDSSVSWGNVNFCIRRMAYIEKKPTFQQEKAWKVCMTGVFVEALLLAWCHLVFISPKDWLPLTLQLIRTEIEQDNVHRWDLCQIPLQIRLFQKITAVIFEVHGKSCFSFWAGFPLTFKLKFSVNSMLS